MKKGSKCGVIGRIQTSSYEGQDGNRRFVTEIVADEIEFAGAKRQGGNDDNSDNNSNDDELLE